MTELWCICEMAKMYMQGVRPVYPVRPEGEWVEELPNVYYCSRCRSEPFGDNLYHYCPNCGARMKGAEE